MAGPIVIIGAGQAGIRAAEMLRKLGCGERIVMLGDEPHPPYQRPPLSKKFLLGEMAESQLYLQGELQRFSAGKREWQELSSASEAGISSKTHRSYPQSCGGTENTPTYHREKEKLRNGVCGVFQASPKIIASTARFACSKPSLASCWSCLARLRIRAIWSAISFWMDKGGRGILNLFA